MDNTLLAAIHAAGHDLISYRLKRYDVKSPEDLRMYIDGDCLWNPKFCQKTGSDYQTSTDAEIGVRQYLGGIGALHAVGCGRDKINVGASNDIREAILLINNWNLSSDLDFQDEVFEILSDNQNIDALNLISSCLLSKPKIPKLIVKWLIDITDGFLSGIDFNVKLRNEFPDSYELLSL